MLKALFQLTRAKASVRLSERQVIVFRPRLTPGLLRKCSASPGRGVFHHGSGRGRQVPGQCTYSDLDGRTILVRTAAAAAIELEASGMAPVACRRARAPERDAPSAQRLRGRDVTMVTGTDEHGEKIAASAAKAGLQPQEHCDAVVSSYTHLWRQVAQRHPCARRPFLRSRFKSCRNLVASSEGQFRIADMQRAPSFHGQAGLRKQRSKPIAAGMLSETVASS